MAAFYAALIGIIAMICLKRHEIKSGRASVVSRLGKGSDHLCHSVFSTIKHGVSYVNKKTFIMIMQWIAFHVLVRVNKIFVAAKERALANPHSRKVIDAVRGRADIKYEGASFYLRRIADK
ncbi:MAG: hypothetical protein QOG91_207 [Candidatus Parcubacteria bacterium]|jgi:hypothetical protein|nr:hypothetical protein [Candidatus Parcubacteria bacterium]